MRGLQRATLAVGSAYRVLLGQFTALGQPSLLSLSGGPSCPGCSLDLPELRDFIMETRKGVQRSDIAPWSQGTPHAGTSFWEAPLRDAQLLECPGSRVGVPLSVP